MFKKLSFSIILVLLVSLLVGTTTVMAEVTLKYANWQWLESGRSDVLQEFVDEFEENNPGVKIEKVSIPYSNYNSALTTQFEAGSGPDVMFVQDMALIPWISKGYLEPLENWIDLNKYKEDFPAQQSTAQKNGKNYGVIYEGFPYGALIINGKLLEEANAEIPETPEELLEVSKKIYEATGNPGLVHPTNFANPSYIMQGGMIVINGFGGKIVKNGEFAVDQPEFIEGVKFLKKIYNLESTPSGMEFGMQREQYLAGQAGMVMDGSYWPSIVKLNNPEMYKDIIVAKLPFPNPASPFETNWYAINSNSSKEKKELAAKFVEFLLSPQNADKWAVVSSIPGLESTYEAVKEEYPWFEVYGEASPHGIVRPLPGYESNTPEIRRMVADAISSAMSGQSTPEEAMNTLKQDLINRFGE